MSDDKGSVNIDEWLRIARTDWERVKRNLKANDISAAGFYLQQSLEKYLKAFLLLRGWRFRKIHELDALLDEAVKHEPGLASFYELCERVTNYYIADRYPGFGDLGVSAKDMENDMAEARNFIKTLFPEEKL